MGALTAWETQKPRVVLGTHTQHTQQKPKQCGDDARVDGGDGDEGGGALVEKGRGRDELEREGDEVERQKNSSATRAAHGQGKHGQPGVEGFTTNPVPGQTVIPAGMILLGENGDTGTRADWAKDGSFLAFRQLASG
ncbi:hypothetical protein JB92DRAFT_2838129 [Gautieria morchelliformis]|nr:hypothetical protein JB92DRAFT_2838129 [Gautieria morchelliformis]